MGPQSDVDKIKDIYRAEREADRIVRDAEAAARALLEEAAEGARKFLEARRADLARQSREALEKGIGEIEREARELLETDRLRTEQWIRRSERSIESIAESLLGRILPP